MIYVYRAEIVAEAKDSIDPYVEVSFAGLKVKFRSFILLISNIELGK